MVAPPGAYLQVCRDEVRPYRVNIVPTVYTGQRYMGSGLSLTLCQINICKSSVCDRDQLGAYGLVEARNPQQPQKSNFLKHYKKYGHGTQWARKPQNPKWATRR